MSHIKNVIPKESYILEVLMDNGNSVILDMKSRLETLGFGMFEDKEFFNCVSTNGKCIKWKDKIEVSVNEVFQLVQK